MSLLWTSAGVGVLALLVVDAFLTLLHASSGAGPYTAGQNRVIWAAARRLAGLGRGVRRRALPMAAPVMAMATPLGWLLLLTLGFALVYQPVVDGFSVQPPAEVPSWLTALYYSGYLTTTLGLGDVIPRGGTWRLAAVGHAALGFALFSGSITYILTIYRRYTDEAGLALRIHGLFPGAADGGPTRVPGHGGDGRLLDWLALDLAADLSAVNVAHKQYPILHYFHGDPERALTVQVGALIEMTEGSGETLSPEASGVLRRAVEAFLAQMPFETGEGSLRARHAALLRAHGFEAG